MLIHSTAIINAEPVRSARLSRPLPDDLPECEFGEGVTVEAKAYIQRGVVIGDGTLVGVGANIFTGARIGKRCLIGDDVSIGRNTVIGDDVKVLAKACLQGSPIIGDGSVIGMGATTSDDNDPRQWAEKQREPVTIGRNVQIGIGAQLLPGVVIGDGATVGAGAVVTKDVRPGDVVVGNPAYVKKPGIARVA